MENNQEPIIQEQEVPMGMEEQMMLEEEEMNQRLMAVLGILATSLDKYIDCKVKYLACANELADLKGEESMPTADKIEKCLLWKNSMMAQAMQLLGASTEGEMMEEQVSPEMESPEYEME